jgi:hypothetical protein
MVVISSAVYTHDVSANDDAYGVVIDSQENILVVGNHHDTDDDYFIMKYLGSPLLSSLSTGIGVPGETKDVIITGTNFYSGVSVSFSGTGITVNSATLDSATQITANITIASDVKLGKRDVTVTNIDESSYVQSQAFEINTANIDKDSAKTIIFAAEYGDVVLEIPANTFSTDTTITVAASAVAASGRATLEKTDMGVEITVGSGEQPLKDITVKVNYRDSDITGLEESNLKLCQYDDVNNRWLTLPTVVYAADNYLLATIDHLSKFGVLQLAAASTLDTSKVFPNPYNPSSGNLTFDNLTSAANIKIYTVAGTLIRELTESNGDSRLEWDGKNESGKTVASGVYIAYIESAADNKIVKIAVVK